MRRSVRYQWQDSAGAAALPLLARHVPGAGSQTAAALIASESLQHSQ